MSHLHFYSRFFPTSLENDQTKKSLHEEYKKYIIENYGNITTSATSVHRNLIDSEMYVGKPLVGIIGGGFAGMYAGLILQSLGIEFEIFESSDRVGGRIYTWYSSDYDPNDAKTKGLYGEVGGMRVPQFANDMLAVQHLALSVNAVLKRNNLADQAIIWRRFFYDSPEQRLRYNTMSEPVTKEQVETSDLTLGFDKKSHGDVPNVWFESQFDKISREDYVPIEVILDVICDPVFVELNKETPNFKELFNKFDKCSMWDYLTTVLKLEDLKKYDASGKKVIADYYFAELGKECDHIPFSVASYLETINVGTNMYSTSVMEIILTVYDWNGSKNHYRPKDQEIYMITVDGGMQRLPNACHTVLNLNDRVEIGEGSEAQEQVGMKKVSDKQQYTAKNLTADAYFNSLNPSSFMSDSLNHPQKCLEESSTNKQRVYLQHKVVGLDYHESYCGTQRGIRMKIKDIQKDEDFIKEYPYVIATLPFGDYLSGSLDSSLLPFDHLSFEKKRAIRECTYMSSFKAFLVFKEQFWYRFGKRYKQGLGVASTDRSGRQVVYPSYGYPDDHESSGKDKPGVLQIYCWSQDARQMGALSDRERINECLKTIQYLYPEVDINEVFAGYDDGKNSKTWFWDEHAGGGAFSFYSPGQFSNIYPSLTTSECKGTLNFAGEVCSLRHGWIVGALNSAYHSVMNILKLEKKEELIEKMKEIWGDENFHT